MGFFLFLAICYIIYLHVQKAKSDKAALDNESRPQFAINRK